MKKERPHEVQAAHLARKALIYVRQSTDPQVLASQGSRADQRAQARWAKEWGWAEEDIEIVEDDLGLSGTSTVYRVGYRRIMNEIRAGGGRRATGFRSQPCQP